MSWLCCFAPCKWIHHFNCDDKVDDYRYGIYQCRRCKSISIGSPR